MKRPLRLKIGTLLGAFAVLLPPGTTGVARPPLFAAPRMENQTHRGRETTSRSTPPSPKNPAAPFRVGEVLNYRVTWAAFTTAASLQVSVPERRNLFGWATWHFRAVLHTQSPVRTLFTIDDEFDSYADAAPLETRQYESYLDELGRRSNQVL